MLGLQTGVSLPATYLVFSPPTFLWALLGLLDQGVIDSLAKAVDTLVVAWDHYTLIYVWNLSLMCFAWLNWRELQWSSLLQTGPSGCVYCPGKSFSRCSMGSTWLSGSSVSRTDLPSCCMVTDFKGMAVYTQVLRLIWDYDPHDTKIWDIYFLQSLLSDLEYIFKFLSCFLPAVSEPMSNSYHLFYLFIFETVNLLQAVPFPIFLGL